MTDRKGKKKTKQKPKEIDLIIAMPMKGKKNAVKKGC